MTLCGIFVWRMTIFVLPCFHLEDKISQNRLGEIQIIINSDQRVDDPKFPRRTTEHSPFGAVDKWTRIDVFRRFLLSAFIDEYKPYFISESLTAFWDCFCSITRSIPETTMRSCNFVLLVYRGLMSCTIASNFRFLTWSVYRLTTPFHGEAI